MRLVALLLASLAACSAGKDSDPTDSRTDADADTDADTDTDPCTEVWYRDADDDSYGDPTDAVTDCTAPAGYVGNDGVSDLALADGTGSGVVDIAYGPIGSSFSRDIRLTGRSSEDFGDSLAAGDVNGDGVDDLLVGAPYSDYAATAGEAGALLVATQIRPKRTGLAAPYSIVSWVNDRSA